MIDPAKWFGDFKPVASKSGVTRVTRVTPEEKARNAEIFEPEGLLPSEGYTRVTPGYSDGSGHDVTHVTQPLPAEGYRRVTEKSSVSQSVAEPVTHVTHVTHENRTGLQKLGEADGIHCPYCGDPLDGGEVLDATDGFVAARIHRRCLDGWIEATAAEWAARTGRGR